MATADCEMCALMGYRSCDKCGNVVFERSALGVDLCEWCK